MNREIHEPRERISFNAKDPFPVGPLGRTPCQNHFAMDVWGNGRLNLLSREGREGGEVRRTGTKFCRLGCLVKIQMNDSHDQWPSVGKIIRQLLCLALFAISKTA